MPRPPRYKIGTWRVTIVQSCREHDLDTDGRRRVKQLSFTGSELHRLAAVEPWPALRIELWPALGSRQAYTLEPQPTLFGPSSASSRKLEALAEELFAWAEARAPQASLEHGWYRTAHVAGEPFDEWPSRGTVQAAYRSHDHALVLADRPLRTRLQRLRDWLSSSPDHPFDEMPRRVRVTPLHLYAQFPDGSRRRYPLRALRAVTSVGNDTERFIFGRRSAVVLVDAAQCPVAALLRRELDRTVRSSMRDYGLADETKVDINRAGAAELEALPFIGPVRARRLIELRTQRGAFHRLEEIMAIPGLGPRQFESIKDSIELGRPPPPHEGSADE
jgi:competence ComEA-like helix-hairpin-helix protein